MDYIFLLTGFLFLTIGGECLVKGSVSLALWLKISKLVVGMTVISFATSAPELLVSIDAALKGYSDISLGNVIGSNIANIGLVLGVTALIFPLKITVSTYKINYPMMFAVSLIFVFMLFYFKAITFWMGICFILWLLLFSVYIIRKSRHQEREDLTDIAKDSLLKSCAFLIIGGVSLYYGSDFLIQGAVSIAREWGVTDRFISISVVAIGTSIPELSASVIAALRKEENLAIGNLLGSNIFNVLAVLGVTSLVTEIPVSDIKILTKDIWVMLAFVVLLYPVMRVFSKSKISRIEGSIMLLVYIFYIYFL